MGWQGWRSHLDQLVALPQTRGRRDIHECYGLCLAAPQWGCGTRFPVAYGRHIRQLVADGRQKDKRRNTAYLGRFQFLASVYPETLPLVGANPVMTPATLIKISEAMTGTFGNKLGAILDPIAKPPGGDAAGTFVKTLISNFY